MFLIMGINNGRKKLNFSQRLICPCCGYSAEIEIIKTFTYFMLFFIPLFRWNKRYFVTMPCCGASCEIDPELGRAIEKGQVDHIDPEDLHFTSGRYSQSGPYYGNYGGGYYNDGPEEGSISSRANMSTKPEPPVLTNSYVDDDGIRRVRIKTCEGCGYETGEDFVFCPKCGKKL